LPARRQVTLATYNVHQWEGADGRCDPERVFRVIRELDAQIVALQEVSLPSDCGPTPADLARATGLIPVSGPTLVRGEADFGNLVLTRWQPARVRRLDLSLPAREPRGALDLVYARPELRVLATHLGLKAYERRRQVAWLLNALDQGPAGPAVLLGDLNEWFLWGPLMRRLARRFGATPARRTFPARLPLLPLDRIWVRPAGALRGVRVHRSSLARAASDHLPLVGRVELAAAA
jgi:endonuclease/exonuclease/phosphatase family metal-dependent hydrolase